jgi:NHS family nucleoside permease-like MFS transporter/NHS family xanthosine MFS transporter
MSLAQVGEVLALVLVGVMLPRWGSKKVMLLGLAFSVVKFGFLFAGGPLWVAGIGVAAHGPAFAFFLVTTFIYLDRQCSAEDRSGVHQIFSFLEAGVANFIGNVGSGLIMDRLTGPLGLVNYRFYWFFPAAGAVVLFLMIFFFLPSRERPAVEEYKFPPLPGDATDQL